MRRLLLMLGAAAVPNAVRAQGGKPPIGVGRVVAQVGAGTLVLPVGYIGGGLATRQVARWLGASDDAASRAANVGAYTGAALATATAVSLIGARAAGIGSFPAAAGGAALGGATSALLVHLFRRPNDAPAKPCHVGCVLASVTIVLLPSAGATAAYDASRRR